MANLSTSCSFCRPSNKKPIRFHINYPEVKEHWDEFNAKRIVLTHMGPEMLAMANQVPEECAYDGLIVKF